MWFIWIMWVIVALAIIATIILLTGKGSMLVSGFNTKSPEERAKYDKKKVSKQAGSIMVFVDIGLLALTSYIHFRAIPAIQNNTISDYGTEITIVALGICVYIIVIGIWAAMRGFKNCKNDGTKQRSKHGYSVQYAIPKREYEYGKIEKPSEGQEHRLFYWVHWLN